jgi:hypothetical protein
MKCCICNGEACGSIGTNEKGWIVTLYYCNKHFDKSSEDLIK